MTKDDMGKKVEEVTNGVPLEQVDVTTASDDQFFSDKFYGFAIEESSVSDENALDPFAFVIYI